VGGICIYIYIYFEDNIKEEKKERTGAKGKVLYIIRSQQKRTQASDLTCEVSTFLCKKTGYRDWKLLSYW